MRLPEVSKRFLTPSKSKKNASLRAPAKKVISPAVTMLGSAPNETSTPEKIFAPTASAERACWPVAMKTSAVWVPFRGSENT